MAASSPVGPVVVLGAGYAGLTVAQELRRRAHDRLPVTLIDRHPVHVLRTELYELGRMIAAKGSPEPWTVPLVRLLEGTAVEFRDGEATAIDLDRRTVELTTGPVAYGSLVVALGNVAAYYGVPGAPEHTYSVYRLGGALALAEKLAATMAASIDLPGERRPRVVVVGGGSTGTEVAAEIASTDWASVTGVGARPPDVVQVTGTVPFLAGLPTGVIARARTLLRRAGVAIVHGFNVARVDPGAVTLEDGTRLGAELVVWCAGLEAPAIVRSLPVPHGHGGRLAVDPHLEVPDRPGVFGVGDVAEWTDPSTGRPAPATAQVAIGEARTAARNVLARRAGAPLVPHRWRERGVVVALGSDRAAGRIGPLNLWSSPAALLKRAVQREYARTARRGEPSGVL